MADNYIERQYEQYEARKAAWDKARKYGKKKKSSVVKTKQELSTANNVTSEKACITEEGTEKL